MVFGFLGKIFGGGIIENAFGMLGDHFKHKRQLKTMEASLKQTVVLEKEKRLTTQENADINWDIAQVKASENSWKDELWTIAFVSVFVASFLPATQDAVREGWKVLSEIDDFWQYSIAACIAASFGTKALYKTIIKK